MMMKTQSDATPATGESASRQIDAKIAALGDWRGPRPHARPDQGGRPVAVPHSA